MKPNCILLLCSILVPACGVFQKDAPNDEKPKPAAAGPQLVGRIASVPADKRFVLIQSYGKWEIKSGQILTTRGLEERTANLRTTGETLGEFAAADLQSGTAAVGDAVYSQHVPKPIEAPTSPDNQHLPVESLTNPVFENVQKNN
jgi:hypothetical protein